MTNAEPMVIEVWSDIACPFCYIGKRRLEAAIARFEHAEDVQVAWRSFQLQPDLRTDPSLRLNDYLAASKGLSAADVERMQAHVRTMGASEGIRFDFDRVVVANTFDAHRLIQYAQSVGLGGAMKSRLLEANFTDGANVADPRTLQRIADEVGLDSGTTRGLLAGDAYADEVRRDIAEARQQRITGVPFFVFDRTYAISGAQPPALFDQALRQAHGEWQAARTPAAPAASGRAP